MIYRDREFAQPQREAVMMGWTLRLFGALFVAGVVAVGAGAASAFEITQAIPSTSQTACLDVEGGNIADGTPIQAYPCTGGFNQQWSLDNQGHLQGLGTHDGDMLCLEANSSNKVVLNSCGQVWEVGSNSNGGFILISDSDNCLDSRGKYGAGAQVIVDTCMGSESQIWALKDIVIEQPIPKTDESACVDTRGNAIANHTPIDAYPCNLGVNERWTYVSGQLQGVTSRQLLSQPLPRQPGQIWRYAAVGAQPVYQYTFGQPDLDIAVADRR
jgi:hypothetical protein